MTPQPLVVIPVFNAFPFLSACLRSVEVASPEAEVLVVDDASTDARVLPFLQQWQARSTRHHLLARRENRGFVHSANTGFARAEGDMVLLNSDTLVTPGWLESLARCLRSATDIATATPWTNNGEIASIPRFCAPNPVPEDPAAVARVLRDLGRPRYPDLPTAVGFCMAISRTAIDALGGFDEKTFGRGYGEENDFSRRASQAGMRNVLCDDAYVAHHGGASFGPLGLRPDETSMKRLLTRHPDYLEHVSAFIREDPLAPRREAVLAALRRAGVKMG